MAIHLLSGRIHADDMYNFITLKDTVLKRRDPLSGFAIHRFMWPILAENLANKINKTHIYLTYFVVRFYVHWGADGSPESL